MQVRVIPFNSLFGVLGGIAALLVCATSSGYAQSPDCQAEYEKEVAAISEEHTKEGVSCHRDSNCILIANNKAAAGIKKAGEKNAKCKKEAFAPPQKGTLDPRQQWTDGPAGSGTSIYMDADGKRWSFPNTRVNGAQKFTLDRTSIQIYKPGGVTLGANAAYKDRTGASIRLDGSRWRSLRESGR